MLLVNGDQSEFRLDDAAERVACFQKVQSETLRGAGHMMQRHQPSALAEILMKFLD